MMRPEEILHFWFNELTPTDWYNSTEVDQLIRQRFTHIHRQATAGECVQWRETIHGRLAEIIVLDQFSRNLYRQSAQAFAYDGMALVLAQEALQAPDLPELTKEELAFLYMPFMHSESLMIHNKAMILFDQPELETNFEYEKKHYAIIKRFGRYPHRNEALGRCSTAEELAFLQEPDSSF